MGKDDYGHRYPFGAGWKDHEISKPQAEELDRTGRSYTLIERALSHFMRGFVGTSDELAHRMGEHILSVRPSCSILHKQGKIERTGEKRKSDGGRDAAVLRLKKIIPEPKPQGDLFQ